MNMSLEKINDGSLPILNATHMLVDEFQDCDEIQYQYMMAHVKSGRVKVTCVGDDDQAIYAFRNSLGYNGMFRFEQEAKATRVVLDTNYRCRKEILVPAEKLIKNNGSRMDKKLKSARGPGGSVTVLRLPSRAKESQQICQKIIETSFGTDIHRFIANRELYPATIDGKKWAVLARNNILLESIDAFLKELDIPAVKSFKSIWDKSPVSLLLTLLKSFNSEDKVNIEHLLHWLGVETEDLEKLSIILKQDYGKLFDRSFTNNLNTESLTKIGSTKIKRFINDLNGWAKGVSRSDADRTNSVIASIGVWMQNHTDKKIEKERIATAISVLLKIKGTINERVAYVLRNDSNEEGNGIQLMTMHGSKGLEFENVWIIAAETDIIPSSASIVPTEDTIAEERRLMYVAMTRAKDNLYISSTSDNPPSVFLKEAKLI